MVNLIIILSYALVNYILVEKACYVLDLAQPTKTWETFPELPQPCAYPAMVYVEKVNRLYSVGCETARYDLEPFVSLHFQTNQTKADIHNQLFRDIYSISHKNIFLKTLLQKGTYVYDFAGSGSNVGQWRDISNGCGYHGKSGTSGYANDGTSCDDSSYAKKRTQFWSARLQNSIIAYDKYIFVYSLNFAWDGSYLASPMVYTMNVETENWENDITGGFYLLQEPSKFLNIYVTLIMVWLYLYLINADNSSFNLNLIS